MAIIPTSANSNFHIWVNGGALVDIVGNTWTQIGTPTFNAAEVLPCANNALAESVSGFSLSNYFDTVPGVGYFNGDWTMTAIVELPASYSLGWLLSRGNYYGNSFTGGVQSDDGPIWSLQPGLYGSANPPYYGGMTLYSTNNNPYTLGATPMPPSTKVLFTMSSTSGYYAYSKLDSISSKTGFWGLQPFDTTGMDPLLRCRLGRSHICGTSWQWIGGVRTLTNVESYFGGKVYEIRLTTDGMTPSEIDALHAGIMQNVTTSPTQLGRIISDGTYAPSANYKWVTQITTGASGLTVQTGAVSVSAAATANSQFIIYAADGTAGAPGTLVASSTANAAFIAGWNYYSFSSPVSLSPSTNYYIGIISDGAWTGNRMATTGTNYRDADTYAGGAADPYGTATTNTNGLTAYVTDQAQTFSVSGITHFGNWMDLQDTPLTVPFPIELGQQGSIGFQLNGGIITVTGTAPQLNVSFDRPMIYDGNYTQVPAFDPYYIDQPTLAADARSIDIPINVLPATISSVTGTGTQVEIAFDRQVYYGGVHTHVPGGTPYDIGTPSMPSTTEIDVPINVAPVPISSVDAGVSPDQIVVSFGDDMSYGGAHTHTPGGSQYDIGVPTYAAPAGLTIPLTISAGGTAPTLVSAVATDAMHVELTWADGNVLTPTGEDPSSYTFTSLTGSTVIATAASFNAGTGVLRLTTSEHTNGATYTVDVAPYVLVSSGDVANAAASTTYAGIGVQPTLYTCVAVSPTRALVVFNEDVDPVSAGTRTNYSIAGLSIGSATVRGPRTVELVTSTMAPHSTYTLVVTGVKDLAGNTI